MDDAGANMDTQSLDLQENRLGISNVNRIGIYLGIIAAGLFAMWLLSVAPTVSAWTSPDTGTTYTMADIHTADPTAVVSIAPGVWDVKQDIIISTSDALNVNNEVILVNGSCQFTIYGTMTADNSQFNKVSGSNWNGIVISTAGKVTVSFSTIENATTGMRVAAGSANSLSLTGVVFKNCNTGLGLRPPAVSAITIGIVRVTFENCVRAANVSGNCPVATFALSSFVGNTYGVYADGASNVNLNDCSFYGNTYTIMGYDTSTITVSSSAGGSSVIDGGRVIMTGAMNVGAGGMLTINSANVTIAGDITVDNTGASKLYISHSSVGFVADGVDRHVQTPSAAVAGTIVEMRNSQFYVASGANNFQVLIIGSALTVVNSTFEHNIGSSLHAMILIPLDNTPTILIENITVRNAAMGIGCINPSAGVTKSVNIVNSTFERCSMGIQAMTIPVNIGYSYFNSNVCDVYLDDTSGKVHNNTFNGTASTFVSIFTNKGFAGTISDNMITGRGQYGFYFQDTVTPYTTDVPVVTRNTLLSTGGTVGIYLENSDADMRNDTISGYSFGIIVAYTVSANKATNCVISNCTYGMYIANPITIVGGKITNCTHGLEYCVSPAPVVGIEIEDCDVGVLAGFASPLLFDRCYVHDCRLGLEVYASALTDNYPTTLRNCNFANNVQGVLTKNSALTTFGCNFTNNVVGVSGAIGSAVAYDNGSAKVITYGFGIHALGYWDRYYLMQATFARLGGTTVLVIDDDRGSDSQANIVATLGSLGISSTVQNVQTSGLPSAAYMSGFSVAFWSTGDYTGGSELDAARINIMKTYLATPGARLVITGDNAMSSLGGTAQYIDFAGAYLGVQPIDVLDPANQKGVFSDANFGSVSVASPGLPICTLAIASKNSTYLLTYNIANPRSMTIQGGNVSGNGIGVMFMPQGNMITLTNGNYTYNKLGVFLDPTASLPSWTIRNGRIIGDTIRLMSTDVIVPQSTSLNITDSTFDCDDLILNNYTTFDGYGSNITCRNLYAWEYVTANIYGSTLAINSSVSTTLMSWGQYGDVAFGDYYGRRAWITSAVRDGAHNFLFIVGNYTELTMTNTDLSYCGIGSGSMMSNGLYLWTFDVYLDGCNITNNYYGLVWYRPYWDSSSIIVRNTRFANNDRGIVFYDMDNYDSWRMITLMDCTFENNMRGIWLYSSNMLNFYLWGCKFNNNDLGFFAEDSFSSHIDYCNFTSNMRSIYLDDSDNTIIRYCNFTDDDAGVWVYHTNYVTFDSDEFYNELNGIYDENYDNYLNYVNCKFTDCDYGIYDYNGDNGIFTYCDFRNNNYGLWLYYSYYTDMNYCNFTQNNEGLYLQDADSTDLFYCNFSQNNYGTYAESSTSFCNFYDCVWSNNTNYGLYTNGGTSYMYYNWQGAIMNTRIQLYGSTYFFGSMVMENTTFSIGGTNYMYIGSQFYAGNSTISGYSYYIDIFSPSRFYNTTIYGCGRSSAGLTSDGIMVYSTTTFDRCIIEWGIYGIIPRSSVVTLENTTIRYMTYAGLYLGSSTVNFRGVCDIYGNNEGIYLTRETSTPIVNFYGGLNIYSNTNGGLVLETIDFTLGSAPDVDIYNNGIGIQHKGNGSLTVDGAHDLTGNTCGISAQYCMLNVRNMGIQDSDTGILAMNGICFVYNSNLQSTDGSGIIFNNVNGGIYGNTINGDIGASIGIQIQGMSPMVTDNTITGSFSAGIMLFYTDAHLARNDVRGQNGAYFILFSNPMIADDTASAPSGWIGIFEQSTVYFDSLTATGMYGFNCTYYSKVHMSNSTLATQVRAIYLDTDSDVVVLNCSLVGAITIIDAQSTLEEQWFVHIRVINEISAPMSCVSVLATDGFGANVISGTTGANGESRWHIVTGSITSIAGVDTSMNPYEFFAYDGIASGYDFQFVIDSSRTVVIMINHAPMLIEPIPTIHINEDSGTTVTSIALSDYFFDYGSLMFTFSWSANFMVFEQGGNLAVSTTMPNWYGTELVTATATDGFGATKTCDFYVVVDPVNDAPLIVGVPDIIATEDELLMFDLTPYISDIDTHISQLSIFENSTYITVSGHTLFLNYPNGVTYDFVNVTVFDGALSCSWQVNVSINPVNDAPTINGVPSLNLTEDVPYAFDVAGYIGDIDSALLTVTTSSTYCSVAGTILIFTYPNGVTSEIVRITVSDGALTAYQDISVLIAPVNDAPTIAGVPDITVVEDVPYTLVVSSYISDIDNHLSQLTITTDSAFASVAGHAITFTYPNGITTQNVLITVSDGSLSASDTITVTVSQVNDAPTIGGIPNLALIEDVPYVLNVSSYIGDIDSAFLTLTTDSLYCAVSGTELTFDYPNGVISEIVRITVSDGFLTAYQDITILITPVNDAPTIVGVPDVAAVEDVPFILDVTPYIADIDNQVSQLVIYDDSPYVSVSEHRLTFLYPNGVLSDTVTITVSDGPLSAMQTISVVVTPVNDAPTIGSIPALYLIEDTSYTLEVGPIINDVDGDPLAVLVDSAYCTVNGTNLTFLYPNGVTSEVVRITVSDGVLTAYRDVTVMIQPVNDGPTIAGAPDITVTEDVPYTFVVSPYIADIDNQQSELAITTDSIYATVIGHAITFLYPDGITTESVTITVSDGYLGASQTIIVTITPVNDAPTIGGIPALYLVEDVPYTIDVAPYIGDIDSAVLTVNEDSIYCTVAGSELTFTYPNGILSEVVRITVSDGALAAYQDVLVTIAPVNDGPSITGMPDITATEDVPYVLNVAPYLADIDNHLSQLTITTNSSYADINGHLLTFLYPNGVLYEYVQITVSDGQYDANMTIFVNVTPTNDAPTIMGIPSLNLTEDVPYSLDVSPFINDIDGDALTVMEDSAYCTVEGTTLTFEYPNGVTSQVVRIMVSDGTAFAFQDVSVQIMPVNDAPTIAGVPDITATEDVPYMLNVAPYIGDIDNHISQLTISEDSQYATVNGHSVTFVYPNGVTTETVTITVSDGYLTASMTIIATIAPVNDAPTILGVPDFEALEDVPYTLNLSSYIGDVDNLASELSIVCSSSYATVNGAEITFVYTEGAPSELVRITVSDGLLSSSVEILATVIPVNDAPTLPALPAITCVEDVPYSLDLSSSIADVDTPRAQLKLYADSPYATVLGHRIVLLYPNGVLGETFNVTISDGLLSTTVMQIVTVTPVNDGPSLVGVPDLALREDTPYTLELSPYIVDIDNTTGDFSVVSVTSDYATISGTNVTFIYPNGVLYEVVRITISDGIETAWQDVRVTIDPVNDAPVIAAIPTVTVVEDVPYLLNLSGYLSDVDNLGSELSVFCRHDYVKVEGQNMRLTFPRNPSNGTATTQITFLVSDGRLTTEGTITVAFTEVNDAPTLSDVKMIPPANADTTQWYTFSVVYTDEENRAPKTIVLVIDDGAQVAMVEADSTDTDFADGKAYVAEVKLAKGAHRYHFETEDGGDASTKVATVPVSFDVAGENTQIKRLENALTNGVNLLSALALIAIVFGCVTLALLITRKKETLDAAREEPRGMHAPPPQTIEPKPEPIPEPSTEPKHEIDPEDDYLEREAEAKLKQREVELSKPEGPDAKLSSKSQSGELESQITGENR